MVRIVTDSLCDIPKELNAGGQICIVPLTVTFEDRSYLDGVDFTHEEFFEMLKRSKSFPKTSHPSAEAFLSVFKSAVDEGDSVICICASPHISGTINAANTARDMLGYGRIDIIDSRSLSMGEGLAVLMAYEMAQEGCAHDEIVARATRYAENGKGLVFLDTVEYIHKGGRLSSSKALIASKLKIRLILKVDPKGMLVMAGRALGVKKAIGWLTEAVGRIRTDFTQTTVAIGYTMKKEVAEEIAKRLRELYKMGNIILYKAGSAVGAHTGPGCGAVFFEA